MNMQIHECTGRCNWLRHVVKVSPGGSLGARVGGHEGTWSGSEGATLIRTCS